MLETDGIPPRLTNQECEELLCQQYYARGQLQQEVDVLLLKVNNRWHQLYFENGVVFWRLQDEEPKPTITQPNDPFSYPFLDIGERYSLKQSIIDDSVTESLLNGVRVLFVFEDRGSLIITHIDNKTSLRFIKNL